MQADSKGDSKHEKTYKHKDSESAVKNPHPVQHPGDYTGQVYQPFSEQGIPAFHTLLPDIQQDGTLHRASQGLEELWCDSQTGKKRIL